MQPATLGPTDIRVLCLGVCCHPTQSDNNVEETLKRIQSHKGVTGIMVLNKDGTTPLARSRLPLLVFGSPPRASSCPSLPSLPSPLLSSRRCRRLSAPPRSRAPAHQTHGIGDGALQPGIPIKSTLDQATTNQYAAAHSQLAAKARSVVRDIDPQNDLTFLRFRTKKHEVMVAPGTLPRNPLRPEVAAPLLMP